MSQLWSFWSCHSIIIVSARGVDSSCWNQFTSHMCCLFFFIFKPQNFSINYGFAIKSNFYFVYILIAKIHYSAGQNYQKNFFYRTFHFLKYTVWDDISKHSVIEKFWFKTNNSRICNFSKFLNIGYFI